MQELRVDLDKPPEHGMVLTLFRNMRGKKRITVVDDRPRRSDRQNRYYWPCFVLPFADFLRGQGEVITDEEAHDLLRAKFLRQTVVNKDTGEPIGQKIRRTKELTTEEFNVYLDQVAHWLAKQFGIVVPDPDVYRVAG